MSRRPKSDAEAQAKKDYRFWAMLKAAQSARCTCGLCKSVRQSITGRPDKG